MEIAWVERTWGERRRVLRDVNAEGNRDKKKALGEASLRDGHLNGDKRRALKPSKI